MSGGDPRLPHRLRSEKSRRQLGRPGFDSRHLHSTSNPPVLQRARWLIRRSTSATGGSSASVSTATRTASRRQLSRWPAVRTRRRVVVRRRHARPACGSSRPTDPASGAPIPRPAVQPATGPTTSVRCSTRSASPRLRCSVGRWEASTRSRARRASRSGHTRGRHRRRRPARRRRSAFAQAQRDGPPTHQTVGAPPPRRPFGVQGPRRDRAPPTRRVGPPHRPRRGSRRSDGDRVAPGSRDRGRSRRRAHPHRRDGRGVPGLGPAVGLRARRRTRYRPSSGRATPTSSSRPSGARSSRPGSPTPVS